MSKCPNCDGVLYTSKRKGFLCPKCGFVAGCRCCRKPLAINALGLAWICSEECLAGVCQAHGADLRTELARLEVEFETFQSRPWDQHRELPLSEVFCRFCDGLSDDHERLSPTEEVPPRGWLDFATTAMEFAATAMTALNALSKLSGSSDRPTQGREDRRVVHDVSTCRCPRCCFMKESVRRRLM